MPLIWSLDVHRKAMPYLVIQGEDAKQKSTYLFSSFSLQMTVFIKPKVFVSGLRAWCPRMIHKPNDFNG